jgi:hypothetical protein
MNNTDIVNVYYPDEKKEIIINGQNLSNSSVCHILYELAKNNGSIEHFELHHRDYDHNIVAQLQNLIDRAKKIKSFKIKLHYSHQRIVNETTVQQARAGNIWIIKAAENMNIETFTLHKFITGDDAHRIMDQIKDISFSKNKIIKLLEVGDTTVPGILSKRPFQVSIT